MFELSASQIDRFRDDGLLIVENVLSDGDVEALRARYECLFRGEFETGVQPDEVNWQEGKSDPSLTRQICNGWKADRTLARILCRPEYGRAIAECMDWPGTRVMIDNVLWKPVGARSLGYHQDNAYLHWFKPGHLCSLWMSMDDVTADAGAMELVRGSHEWRHSDPDGEFHGPEDYRGPMLKAAELEGMDPDIVYVAVPKGGGSIHPWLDVARLRVPTREPTPRRALVLHAMSSEVEYVPGAFRPRHRGRSTAATRRFGDNTVDENHFPIIWTRDGRRTAHLDEYCAAA